MTFYVKPFTDQDLKSHLHAREGEIKLGEKVQLPKTAFPECLNSAKKAGAQFVVLGISEDIGQRANLGRGGAKAAWSAFLAAFLNTQANKFVDPSRCLLLGEVDVKDLQDSSNGMSVGELRKLCTEIDARVEPIIEQIAKAGLKSIVIGGGHNNTYPILKGVASSNKEGKLACVNLDAHADFRALEGRHSGNGFRYAHAEGFLAAYSVIGLHESYITQENIEALEKAGFSWITFEQTHIRKTISFEDALRQSASYLEASNLPVGIELDVDSIALMPSSAESPYGVRVSSAARFVHFMVTNTESAYLHLSEGGPQFHPGDGTRHVGRTISILALTYLKAHI